MAAARAGVPLGSEFQVNSYITDNQTAPAVAMEADGDFVIVWSSYYQDGYGRGIFLRRFDSAGSALGDELQVNSYTMKDQAYPVVAKQPNGDFVVVWTSDGQDGYSYGVFAQRFSSAGTPQGGEFQVNSYTTYGQLGPSVATDGEGDFVVTWHSEQDGSGYGVFARRFSSAGSPQASEFQVNSYTTTDQFYGAVAMSSAGGFIVVWESLGDGSDRGIFGQRFDAAGSRQAAEFQVNSYTNARQADASIAADDAGDFVVAWDSSGQDGSFFGAFAQRFDAAGSRQGAEFQVNSYTLNFQSDPAVATDSDGDFIMVWGSFTQDGSGAGTFLRRYDSAGIPQTGELQVNSFTPNNQFLPVVATDDDGDFVVVWASDLQDGDAALGIFARRFEAVTPIATLTPSPTLTPSVTTTPTTSPTATRTNTPTITATATLTATATKTTTPTSTATPSATPSPTRTPTASTTPTPTRTSTATRTPTSTATPTATPSPTRTPTASTTPTPSKTSTATATPTASATATPTRTSTATSTATPTATGSVTAGPTATATASPTATRTPTATASPTATRTPTATASATATATITSTATRTPTPTASPTASLSPTPTATSSGPVLDIDDNGSFGALTDGLLVLRYLFGFTGDTLVSGAVGAGCGRCSAGDLETYLGAIKSQLDVDGNGSFGALTDGLLVLRYLFGFTGDTLIAGAVGGSCTRCTAGAIVTYLDGLKN